ncbi:hypothetical protein SALCHL_003250 [Streptomyces albus subsp. chlorinus]|uniref:hypothetical protein n=1 Tax=Streptomyces albus TaxID=1888 RepID=UPI00156D7373|nr:hypothetical protein [Streptomyces albus]
MSDHVSQSTTRPLEDLQALEERTGLGAKWLREVCHDHAARIFESDRIPRPVLRTANS